MAGGTVTIVEGLMDKLPEDHHIRLWDCEFTKEGRERYLKVFIDRTDGQYVSTDDCEKVSIFLSEELDKLDPIAENYYLMVSSPGMDRELKRPWHYEASIGKEVEVSLYGPLSGEYEGLDLKSFGIRNFTGILTSFAETEGGYTAGFDTVIDLRKKNRKLGARISPQALKEISIEIPLKEISKINLAVIFD